VFPHSSTGQKVIGQAKGRHHERGNIREEASVLWCLFRNLTNTVAPFPVKVLKLAHQQYAIYTTRSKYQGTIP
jgi:hypothetical protein